MALARPCLASLARRAASCNAYMQHARHMSVLAPGSLSYAHGVSDQPLSSDTTGTAFDRTCARLPNHIAYISVHDGVSRTFAEHARDVDALAGSLLALGLERGDRIAIWAPNLWQWACLQIAAAKAGLVLVCINPAYRVHELVYAVKKVGCVALVAATHFKSSDYTSMLQQAFPEMLACAPGQLRAAAAPALRHVITLGDAHVHGMHNFNAVMRYGSESDVRAMQAASLTVQCDDVTNIQFTSGTTGQPKATALTHHNIINNALIVGRNIRMGAGDVLLNNVPLMHCFGQVMGALAAMQFGTTVVYPSAVFDAASSLRVAARYNASIVYGVPTMFLSMLNHPLLPQLRPQLQQLRTGIMAGSICPAPLMSRVENELGIRELCICYGMTETSPVSTQTSPSDPMWARTETVGRVAPHTEVRVADAATGVTLPRGQPGELLVRGYLVMRGYYGDDAKTAESIKNGWMHTGDLATMDDEGYVRIVGRIKDLIIRGGENIAPKEVETFLYSHPAIQDAAVFGVYDEVMGEEVAAAIILKEGKHATAEEVRSFCKGDIAHYKVPKFVRFMDAFPLTVSGKIQKFILRADLEAELKRGKRSTARNGGGPHKRA